MPTSLRRPRTPRDRRDFDALAADPFPTCETHRRETVALYRALEAMRPSPARIDLDATIAQCLPGESNEGVLLRL